MKDGLVQIDAEAAIQPRMLFKPGSWLAKIDFINHLVLLNNVLIAVLAEKEGGKSSFNTLLQNNLDQQIKAISLSANPSFDREQLISDVATQLHLNYDEQTTIESLVAQVNEHKSHVLLIIDDAQNVSEPIIKEAMLAIKNQGNFGFFHLCLISDYSVLATLNDLAEDEFNNLIHTIEVSSLNESETRTYVLQRAMGARLINKPLTDNQYKQFYQLTKGNVAKINSSLESFISKCSIQMKNNKRVALKRTSMLLSAALITGISYLYISNEQYGDTTSNGVSSSLTQLPNSVDKIKENAVQSEQLISQIASWQEGSTRQLVEFALPKKQLLDDHLDDDNSNIMAIVDKVVYIPSIKVNNRISNNDAPITKLKENAKLIQLGALQSVTQSLHVADAKKNKQQNNQVVKNAVGRYTIQLVASHKKSDIHRFRKNNKLFSNTKLRHFTNQNGTWYVLTYGEYTSRNQAIIAINKFPSALVKMNPWIRPVSGLANIG